MGWTAGKLSLPAGLGGPLQWGSASAPLVRSRRHRSHRLPHHSAEVKATIAVCQYHCSTIAASLQCQEGRTGGCSRYICSAVCQEAKGLRGVVSQLEGHVGAQRSGGGGVVVAQQGDGAGRQMQMRVNQGLEATACWSSQGAPSQVQEQLQTVQPMEPWRVYTHAV